MASTSNERSPWSPPPAKYFKSLPENPNKRGRLCKAAFNYDITKEKFYEEIRLSCRDTSVFKGKEWSKKGIQQVIADIKEGNSLIAAGSCPDLMSLTLIRLMALYEIIEENDEEILVYKKRGQNGRILRVVALEDMFDIIEEAHRVCGHGKRMKTMEIIRTKYNIPMVAVDIFMGTCNVCRGQTANCLEPKSTDVRNLFPRFNFTVQVGFINMKRYFDGPFNHILYYLDKTTNFLIMRALVSNNEVEISTELLKIFADFGPPQEIKTYYGILLKRSVDILKESFPIWDVSVVQMNEDFTSTANMIISFLRKWMTNNDCQNWSIACRMLQFQKNNGKIPGKLYTPYNTVFGYNSNCDIFNNNNVNEQDNDSKDESTNTVVSETEDEKDMEKTSIGTVSQDSLATEEETNSGGIYNEHIIEIDDYESHGTDIEETTIIIKCHVCNNEVTAKKHVCSKCYKDVHLMCSSRLHIKKKSGPVIVIICNSCNAKEGKNEERSVLFDELAEGYSEDNGNDIITLSP